VASTAFLMEDPIFQSSSLPDKLIDINMNDSKAEEDVIRVEDIQNFKEVIQNQSPHLIIINLDTRKLRPFFIFQPSEVFKNMSVPPNMLTFLA